MKKYIVHDGESEYEVKEFEKEDLDEVEDEDIEEVNETKVELTDDEITALKSLAAVAPKLIAMTEAKDADEDKDEGLETCDADADEDEDEDEETIVETETKPTRDSKCSFGSNEKSKVRTDDSLVDEVSEAWAKRYGGR